MPNPLIEIARRGAFFTATDGQAFIHLPVPSSGGYYILPVRSPAFRHWFFHEFAVQFDDIPTSHAFHSFLNYAEAEANLGDSTQLAVYRRVGARGPALWPNQILLDLADPERHFAQISPTGWTVTAGANALLKTSHANMSLPIPELELPDPSRQPPLARLRDCLNLSSQADWLRVLAWLLSALRPAGPFPILILQGPAGSGKSVAARILRSLIDTCSSPLTPIPSSVRDLLSLARNNWVLAFDHVSSFSAPLTDALCRLSSGLGVALRENWGPAAEPLQQNYKCPIILTASDRWTCPPCLAARALTVNLPPLSSPRPEGDVLFAFNEDWPAILGALCSAVSTALSRQTGSPLPAGRCASALAWAMAASPALGCTEAEMQSAFADPQPAHPMVEAVRNLLQQRRQWTGSATQLLDLLQPALSCGAPNHLSRQLRASTLVLADCGIELKFRRLHEGARIIELRDDPGDDQGDDPPEKTPPGSSPDFGPSQQTTEPEELINP